MLLIELAFPAGRYHATAWGRHVNEGIPEWPPSPYRLVRALYDAWKRKKPEWEAARVERVLCALCESRPHYRLPAAIATHTRSYLSKNEEDPQAKTLIFDGFVALSPRVTVLMGWPEAAPIPEVLDDLDQLLSVLNYLGRSESWIAARVIHGITSVDWNCSPAAASTSAGDMEIIPVAVPLEPDAYKPPTQKPLPWMDAIATGTEVILKNGWSHPPAMRYADYFRPADCFAPGRHAAPAQPETNIRAVLYSFDSKVLPQVTETLEVAERARIKLMGIHKRLTGGPEHVSPKFSGKDASGGPLSGHPHAFYLPLDRDGDGRLDHLLVYCRTPFDVFECRALDEFHSLWQTGGRPEVRCIPVDWNAPRRPESILESATPFVPARHYRRGRGDFNEWLRQEVARECLNHGLPVPLRVEGSPALLLGGSRAIQWFEFRRNRKEDRVRSGYGLRVEFGEPVDAPLALGYGCHFGLGQLRRVDRKCGRAI